MKEEDTVEGQYVSKVNTNEFKFDYENAVDNVERADKLASLLQSPWRLIKEGGSLGISGVKTLVGIVVLFSITNIILFCYSVASLFISGYENSKAAFVLLVAMIGFAITFYAGYKAYQYLVANTSQVIYKNFRPLFQKICSLVIDNIERIVKGNKTASDSQLAKAIDFGKLVNEHYQGLPSLLKIGINKMLNKVPVTEMITDLHQDIMNGDKEEASTKLFARLDDFICNSIFAMNNTKWVYWLLPLNILVQVLIVVFKIG